MIVTDTSVAPLGTLERRIECALEAAMPRSIVVQLRDRTLGDRPRLALGRRLAELSVRHGQYFIVNERCDMARILGAVGVHLPEHGVTPVDVRAVLGPRAWVSCATHRPDAAVPQGADALVLSPVIAPRKGRAALGIAGVARARSAMMGYEHRPLLYALGGVDESNAAGCIASGADGVSVIGAVLRSDDPRPLLRAIGALRV
jgi:thiamine-phosphate pyrophosphorylase